VAGESPFRELYAPPKSAELAMFHNVACLGIMNESFLLFRLDDRGHSLVSARATREGVDSFSSPAIVDLLANVTNVSQQTKSNIPKDRQQQLIAKPWFFGCRSEFTNLPLNTYSPPNILSLCVYEGARLHLMYRAPYNVYLSYIEKKKTRRTTFS
jgi:hypothetical protein